MKSAGIGFKNQFRNHPTVNRKAILMISLMLMVVASPLSNSAQASEIEDIEILETVVNPANNHTYHLLSASSWTDAALVARSLDGFLVTVDDAEEDQWLFDTFAVNNDTTRHLWIGLSDANSEGDFRWHDGTPFLYRNWGEGQPGEGDDEDYIHITGTNMGSIEAASWNDLENDPQYFPVYGVVEVGGGADYALRFDGYEDHIVIDEEMPDWNSEIEIEAWVNVPDTDGIQFITMYGDYGWGLYLNDGYLAYSNEYSLSQNPTSNVTINEDIWTHIKVVVNSSTGGEFFIDNQPAGLIDVNDSQIPAGDFGSNDCFQSGDDCDELFIGRMGAGCDCNYFQGMIDDVTIRNSMNQSVWAFPEGEGSTTIDSMNRTGLIHGAAWVMPDGSIIAQAIEIGNGDYVTVEDANQGDTLLFFMEIPENTRYLTLELYSWNDWFEDDGEDWEEIDLEIYISIDEIPTAWNHDHHLDWYGYSAWDYIEWPDAGTYWITVTSINGFDEMEIGAYWEQAPEPPELDEMTELFDGISITNQGIPRNSDEPLYFYVDLEDDLAELRVQTWGGNGNCDLHIALGVLPYDEYAYFDFATEATGANGRQLGGQSTSDHSYNHHNDEIVNIFDAQSGIYYVMMTSYRACNSVTIQADFTYQPQNAEPESAIELTPGVEYGPLSGFATLDQYFFIDVPEGTERLEVDLNNGEGEARLMLRHEAFPTWTTYDKHSNSPGADDKVAFNDPTPGKWYILLGSEEFYSRIDITASFTDRYVWEYDGEPIQLFNDESVEGMSAPEGEELYFFIDLENDAMGLEITTWGGEGDLALFAEFEAVVFEWDEDRPPMGRQSSETITYESDYGAADEEIEIWYASGRIDITIYANSDIEDIGIKANWEEMDDPWGPDPDPDPEPEPSDIEPCDAMVLDIFTDIDTNGDGDITLDESGLDEETFSDIDYNDDGFIEVVEIKQEICRCENELYSVFNEIDTYELSVEFLKEVKWKNEYDFTSMDSNGDMYVDWDEMDEYAENCVTTYDAFDRDGDGTPDVDDEFPDDPSEQKDTDGDGVGDNSDIIASVDNDVIWMGAGVFALILVSLLAMMVIKGRNTPEDWNYNRGSSNISERMLDAHEAKSTVDIPLQNQEIVPPALDLGPVDEVPEGMKVSDLFD